MVTTQKLKLVQNHNYDKNFNIKLRQNLKTQFATKLKTIIFTTQKITMIKLKKHKLGQNSNCNKT